MILKEQLDSLIGKPIDVIINDCKLFPFGFNRSFKKMYLKEHSPNFYMVMVDDFCITLFGIEKITKFEVSYDEDEIFDLKWKGYRIVNLDNI